MDERKMIGGDGGRFIKWEPDQVGQDHYLTFKGTKPGTYGELAVTMDDDGIVTFGVTGQLKQSIPLVKPGQRIGIRYLGLKKNSKPGGKDFKAFEVWDAPADQEVAF